MDARGQDEEGAGTGRRRPRTMRPAVVADAPARTGPTGSRRQQRRPDGDARQRTQQRHGVARPASAPAPATVSPPEPDERPGVEGVDRQVGIAAGRAAMSAGSSGCPCRTAARATKNERAPTTSAEVTRRTGPCSRASQPRSRRGPHGAWRGPEPGAQQVPLQQHDGDERDEHDAELGLDQRRQDRHARRRPRCCRG